MKQFDFDAIKPKEGLSLDEKLTLFIFKQTGITVSLAEIQAYLLETIHTDWEPLQAIRFYILRNEDSDDTE